MSLLDDVKQEPIDLMTIIKQEKLDLDEYSDCKRVKFEQNSFISKHIVCPICNQNFNSKTDLKIHIQSTFIKNDSPEHKCSACGSIFKFLKQFLVHKCDFIDLKDPLIRVADPDDPKNYSSDHCVYYLCKFCEINNLSSSQFTDYEGYLGHLNSHHNPVSEINCSFCEKKTQLKHIDDYLVHLNQKHQIYAFNDCSSKSKESTDKNSQQNSEIYHCGLCKYSVKDNSPGSHLNFHLLTHVETGNNKINLNPPKIYCKACKIMFKFQHDFNLHLMEHVRENNSYLGDKLYCPLCVDVNANTIEFSNNLEKFNSHVNEVHLNFICGICKSSKSGSKVFGTKLQTGHSIEEHHKKYHLNEMNVRTLMPNFLVKGVSRLFIEVENVFCGKCSRFFDCSATLNAHTAKHYDNCRNNL